MLTLKAVHAALADADWEACKPWRVAVLRNITVEPIEPYWQYCAYQSGLKAELAFGDFDNVVQEALGGSQEIGLAEADCVLVFLYLETLSPLLSSGYATLSMEERGVELERVEAILASVVQGIRQSSSAMIVMHSFELPTVPAYGALDASMPEGHRAIVAGLNQTLQRICASLADCYVVDTNSILQALGREAYFDRRYWHIGRAPYSGKALNMLAAEHAKLLRARVGKQKKCLLLDCDNTLWGGVVGEEGVDGIALGSEYPGSVYTSVQNEIVALANRGVIIGLVSKNNEADVWQVFESHAGMPLKKEHIAGFRINWDDKATNIASLVQELNIGMDSVVFVDDSDFELNLVANALPEVEVLKFPKNPMEFEGWLLGCGLFDTLSVSQEDRNRNRMYQAEGKRKELLGNALDLEQYYASLEMVVELHVITESDIPRAAQLTQKTNQFNLTTLRYAENELSDFISGDNSFGIQVRLRDKFDDYGVVGVALVDIRGDLAEIDSLLMSCRALGRKVEQCLLREVLRYAHRRGAKSVLGRYIPTPKNAQTASFYTDNNFQPGPSGAEGEFLYDLEQGIPNAASNFSRIESELERD